MSIKDTNLTAPLNKILKAQNISNNDKELYVLLQTLKKMIIHAPKRNALTDAESAMYDEMTNLTGKINDVFLDHEKRKAEEKRKEKEAEKDTKKALTRFLKQEGLFNEEIAGVFENDEKELDRAVMEFFGKRGLSVSTSFTGTTICPEYDRYMYSIAWVENGLPKLAVYDVIHSFTKE